MGRVFTWRQIKKRELPKVQDFLDIEKAIRDEIALASRAGNVNSAVFYGSFAKRKATLEKVDPNLDAYCRMDIDVAIRIPDKEGALYKLDTVFCQIGAYARQHYVPVDCAILSGAEIHHDSDATGPLFGSHISCYGKDPKASIFRGSQIMDGICFCQEDVTAEYRSTLKSKLIKLNYGISNRNLDEVNLCRFLKTVLETPARIGHKFTSWAEVINEEESGSKNSGAISTSSMEAGLQQFREFELLERLRLLRDIDEQYTDLVSIQLVDPDKNEYHRFLDYLSNEVIYDVRVFVDDMGKLVHRIIKESTSPALEAERRRIRRRDRVLKSLKKGG